MKSHFLNSLFSYTLDLSENIQVNEPIMIIGFLESAITTQ